MIDLCLANSAGISNELRERYSSEGAAPLVLDRERIEARGIAVVERDISSEDGSFARHDPRKLAAAILELYNGRAVQLYGGGRCYEKE